MLRSAASHAALLAIRFARPSPLISFPPTTCHAQIMTASPSDHASGGLASHLIPCLRLPLPTPQSEYLFPVKVMAVGETSQFAPWTLPFTVRRG